MASKQYFLLPTGLLGNIFDYIASLFSSFFFYHFSTFLNILDLPLFLISYLLVHFFVTHFCISMFCLFSLKLLWAPIVDSVYWKRMGRRKSWMVPCQYLIGIFMLILSYKVADIMGDESEGLYTFILLSFKKLEINCITALIHHFFPDSKAPNVLFLMLIFLPLNFLAATQDIAVDGWALTILSRLFLIDYFCCYFFWK